MAVETHHIDLFPSQLLVTNRDFLKTNQGNLNLYTTQMDSSFVFNDIMPLPSPPSLPLPLPPPPPPAAGLPFYQSIACDPILAKSSSMNNNKDDSGLTCNVSASRKRARDHINDFDGVALQSHQKPKFSGHLSSFLDEHIVFQMQHQQSEIDSFIADHNQKVRMELEERRKKQTRMLATAIQQGIMKKLKEREEEVERIGKLNWVLQERVRSLYVENQIWKDLARSNEATANSLRSNLEQVLAHVSEGSSHMTTGAGDAESSCGSREEEGGRRRIAGGGGEEEEEEEGVVVKDKKCKRCGEREASVLLLPCRHMCLCAVCGSTLLATCPLCHSPMSGSVHVNLS